MSIAATVGRPVVTDFATCIHDGFVSFEQLRGVDREFLFYVLKGLEDSWSSAGQTGSQTNVNTSIVSGRQVTIPADEDEQRRIALALGDVDDSISALKRMIVKQQAIRQGLLQQLLTGRTRLPEFSDPWCDVLLGDHVSYVRNVALSRAQLDNKSPVRYLHYGDIHTRSTVKLDAVDDAMPRASDALLGNAGRLQVGDVVFADASEDPDGVGKSVEITAVPEEGVVPGLHTIAARFDRSVLADGFKAYLQFIPLFRQALLRLAAGTKVLATTRSFISSVNVPLPGVDEQRAIATVLDDSAAAIEALEARLLKAQRIKQGMMQELLTGRTRLSATEDAA